MVTTGVMDTVGDKVVVMTGGFVVSSSCVVVVVVVVVEKGVAEGVCVLTTGVMEGVGD